MFAQVLEQGTGLKRLLAFIDLNDQGADRSCFVWLANALNDDRSASGVMFCVSLA
jgi:hypothetical protein